ncbi:MAG: hypothetical protein M1833_001244 [Piccolia ochrophora]|nr:MAG: hypothetical protein M1833_001244 [Piccolia ochrophora]
MANDFELQASGANPDQASQKSLHGENGDVSSESAAPATAASALQRWNKPRLNMWRLFATFASFTILGANDAAYGALIPYLETYYDITYTVISLVFLSPFAGYGSAALCVNLIHMKLGVRGVAFLGPCCHIIAYTVTAVHPPYPVLVVIFMLAGFGNGLLDAAWNAWVGPMANSNELLGFLHGFYGLGATLSPLIATTMITKAGFPWYSFYYIMVGAAVLETIVCTAAFWSEDGKKFRAEHPRTTDRKGGRTREALSHKVTWIISLFIFCYVGVEVALGGWIVTFMIRIRKGDPFAAGISSVGFWLGITIGRVVLGFVSPRIGLKLSVAVYLLISMALELLFWLIPQFIVSAIAVAFLGFFLAPMFPAGVVAATRLLPKHLHVSAIGFAAAFGGGGASLYPFIVGAIAQSKGVQTMQPVILALMVVVLGLWLALPRRMGREHEKS